MEKRSGGALQRKETTAVERRTWSQWPFSFPLLRPLPFLATPLQLKRPEPGASLSIHTLRCANISKNQGGKPVETRHQLGTAFVGHFWPTSAGRRRPRLFPPRPPTLSAALASTTRVSRLPYQRWISAPDSPIPAPPAPCPPQSAHDVALCLSPRFSSAVFPEYRRLAAAPRAPRTALPPAARCSCYSAEATALG